MTENYVRSLLMGPHAACTPKRSGFDIFHKTSNFPERNLSAAKIISWFLKFILKIMGWIIDLECTFFWNLDPSIVERLSPKWYLVDIIYTSPRQFYGWDITWSPAILTLYFVAQVQNSFGDGEVEPGGDWAEPGLAPVCCCQSFLFFGIVLGWKDFVRTFWLKGG